jgi:hypothetical protein
MKTMNRVLFSVALAGSVVWATEVRAAEPLVSPRGSANPVKVSPGVNEVDLVTGKTLPKSSPRLQAMPHPVVPSGGKKDPNLVKETPVYTGKIPNPKPVTRKPDLAPQFETTPAPAPAPPKR